MSQVSLKMLEAQPGLNMRDNIANVTSERTIYHILVFKREI